MVFQRFNLFPHMTALENIIEAPVHVRSDAARPRRAEQRTGMLDRVGLADKADAYPRSSRAVSSSASRSPGRWPWSRS